MSRPSVTRTAITLASIAAICTALVAATFHATRDRIAANEKAMLEQSLEPALSGILYNSDVSESRIVIAAPHDLPGNDPAIIYRVYADDAPVAALFVVTARDGFSGPIRILLGVNVDGVVSGLRILEHRETPGLGDRISSTRSDWVYQFDGRSLGDPEVNRWSIRADGGDFDQLTGASVTPRAVIKAAKETLIYFDAHKGDIFSQPASGEVE